MAREIAIGVLGGMGVRATWAFCQALTDCIPFEKEWEHPRVVVDCATHIPSRSRHVLMGEASPVPGMVDCIRGLGRAGAGFVVVPCNQAHAWYDEVCQQTGVPWLDIRGAVARKIPDGARVMILGGPVTMAKRLYDSERYEAVYPDLILREQVVRLIEEGKTNVGSCGCIDGLLPSMDVDVVVVLACTELWSHDPRVINSLEVYAEAAYERYLSGGR